ncbi:uncharacterized protein LOC100376626 isoform X8 [Saccoglossus kowalevskii]
MEKKREKTPESRLMVNTPDLQIMSLKKSNDEMRKHISKLKSDLEQERSNIKKIKRERVVDIRSAREKEYQRAMMAISDLRNKLHQEKINELLAQKDTLTRQYEMEVKKIVKQKEDSLGKMQSELHRTKEDLLVRMKHRIAADAQDEVKKKFEVERSKMQQEILELKESKRKIENEFNQISDAERRRIAENKWIQDKHILEMEQLRKETRRDICRMVDELKKKEKLVGELEKEVGHHSGHSRKLQAEKESLKDELSNIMKMADTWERSSTPGICSPRSKSPPTSPRPGTPRSIPSPRPPALGRLTPDAQALEDFERERFHCRLSELVHLVRRLEDENSKLQRAKEALEGKLKNADFTSERNKLNKIIEDLEHDKKRLENTCKTLNEENKKKISLSKLPIRRQESVGYGSRRSSSTDSSDNSEAEKFKKIMDDNFKTITELKNQIIEKDRRLDLIQHRRRKARRRQSGILESPKGLEDEIGLDTASITSSISQRSDNSISGEWDEFERAEMEGNYQQLSKEYLQLKKAYTQLQAMVGGSLDVQREFKLREQLELDLLDSQAKIEDFQKVIKDQGKDAGWVEEKQKFITYNRNLQSKVEEKEDAIKKVKRDLNDSRDQNELLEFRILELEERSESSHTAVPESLSSLSPSSPNTIVRRSPSPAALPLIQVTETDGISLQIAVNETGFTDMSVVDIKQKLEDIANNKDDDRLSVEDKKSLLQARAMLDIADLKLKKMTSSETSLKRKVMDLEHEKDRLAAKVSSTEVELRSNLNVLDDCNKKIDELEEIIEDRKKSESKFHAMEDVYLKNESKLKDEIKLLKKQMSSDKEGRDYENELLFQKIAEVRDEKQTELLPQKVAILEESNSALQEKLDRVSDSSLQSKLDSLVKEDTLAAKEGAESKQIELKSVMTLEELQHLKAKVDEIKAAHQKIAEMEQTELVLRKHIEALEREIVELQENIQHHESSYNEKVEEYEIREHTLKEISRKAEQAEVQLKEQLDASISEDSKKGEQIQELCLKIKILESSETSSKQKFDSDAINQNLDTELKQLKSENEKLSNQLNSYELAEKELKGQINQIKVENDVLKDKLQLLEIENPNLKSLPGDKTDDDKENGDVLKMKDRIWELESSEKVLEADLFDLKEENEKLKSKLMNGDSEPMHSEIEVSETQEQTINDLRTSQTSLKEALSKTTSEKENLLKMYQDALEKLQELETDEKIDQSPSLDVTSEAQVQSSVEQPIERVTVENVSMPQNLLLNMDSQKEQSYADRVYELQASENVLKNIVKDLQVSEEELNNKIVELTSEKAELVAQLRDANLKDEESEKVIKEHENEVSMLKMKIGEIETTKEKLEEESALLTRQLEVANQKLQEVEERNAEVNKLNNDLQVSEAQMKEEMLEMSSEKEEIEVKLLEAREELKKTNERIDNLTASESNLSEQLNNVITEKETLAADLKESNVRLVNQEQRLESVIAAAGEEKVKVLTKENDELTQKLEEAENRIEEQDIQETVLKKIINELEDSEKTSRERIVELEESGKTVKAALDGQEKTSEDLREKLDEVEKSEKELQEKVLQLENSDKDLRDKLSELESAQLDSSNNEALMKEIKELELEVQRRKDIEVDLKEDHFEELTSLQEQIQDLERTNQELRKKLAELSEELECIDELKKEHLSEVSNLQGKIKDLENQNAEDSNKFEDLKQSLSMEIATLKEQVDDLENSERDIRSKLSQNSDALFKSQKSYEEDQKMWNEKEHHLKDQLSESEVVIKTLNEKVQALQQQEVTLKKEVEKQEEIKVKASEREIATYSLQERIAELQECESLLKAKIIELTESEESAKKNYQETLKDRIENEKAWKVKIKDLEDTEDKSRLRLQEMEVVEIDLREQLEAKVRENEVASEMWRQSEDLLNERVAELEELETVLKQRIQELEDNESHLKQEIKQKTKETENTWKQAAESSTLAYQERIHELEELEGDLKDRISQLAEAERTAKDMLQEATVVYRENEEALKERIEQLEEDQGEMQGQIHALENLKAMMRGQIEDAEQHNKETQKANKRLQEKIEQFESGEQAHKDELNRMKKQLETTEQAEKESQKLLSQQLEDIQTESKSNEKNLRDRVKELEYSDNELQNKLYETETVKTELEDRLESAEIENKRVKESNNHLKEQIDELEEENSKLRRDLEDTQEKADESERISSELKDRLHETESVGDMKKMEEQKSLEKIQKQIEELQMSEEMLKDDVEHLERSERKLKQKLTEKNADIDKLYQQRKVEKDEMRSRILDLEMSEMKLKEQVHVLDMEVKKKTWDIERIQPQIKFQTEQIDTVGKQEIKHKELANCLRKKVEQLEQREKDLKNDIMMASDSQSPLKEKLSRSERRETELVKKVERLEKSEETLKAAVLSLEQAKDTKTKKEIEELNEQVQQLEDVADKLRHDLKRSENSEKSIKKLHTALEDDFSYLKEEESKLRNRLKDIEKEKGQSKKRYDEDYEELQDKVIALEKVEQTLKKKLESSKKTEEALQKELNTAEEMFDKTENTLKQTNKALERKLKQLEEAIDRSQLREKELETSGNSLQQKLKMLEKSECALKDQVSELENQELNFKHQVRELESAERMLKMDNDQLKLEKDLLTDKMDDVKKSESDLQKKTGELQMNEKKLKEKVVALEKQLNVLREKVKEMETSAATMETRCAQASKLEKELSDTQDELQESHTKIDQLERAKASLKRQLENLEDDLATGQMITLPLEEYKRMKAQTGLLEMTEQSVEDLEKTEAKLQDKLKKMEEQKDYCDADKEILNLRLQLDEKNEERAALLRDRDISYKIKEIEEIADLKYKLQEKEEALEEKCKLSKSLRMENTQLHAEFRDKNGQLTSLKAEVMRLERLLRGSHSDDGQVAALREELEGKQKQLQDKKEEMNKMTNLNDVYRTKLDRREKDLAAKEQELEQKNSELQKLRHEVGGLEQQKKIAQTSADSKYNELAGKYEALKQEFQAKCLELDSTLEELKSLKKKYEDLKNKLKDLEKIRDERDIILGKLQALEAALKLKADQEQKLFEELAMLTRKLEDYEKLNTTRDGIEESFREIKNNYDDMEHKKREAELAVAPLKAKVSRLVKKCKERDELIKKLTNELRQQHKGHPNELLEAVTKLQSRMPDEEYNEPMSPYSTTLHGIHEVSEVTRENSDVGVESSPSLSSLYTRRTPTLPTRMINELSEPLWQTIESSSPATVGRHQQLQLDVDNIQDTDEAAMQELLRSLSSDPIGSSSNRSTSSQVAATLPQTSATTRDRKSPGSALQELLTVDPELARMLDRGSNMGDGRDSGDMLQGTGSSERPRSSTPRRQRPRDSSHLRQSPEEILRLHSRLSETRSNPYEFNYEPSPSLAEEASQLEQLHNINSPMFIDGVPIATSPRLSMSLPQPVSSQPLSSKNLPQLSAPTLLSMGVQPTQNIGSVPAAFSSIPGTHNGNIPSSANGGVPTYLRGAGLDRPDLGSLSLSNSSMLSPAGLPTAALLPPTLACKSEGPPLSPSDFCISRIVSSRSVLLTWVPPAMDEMAKSNGAQVAGYRVYLNNKQKQLVNSAHLTKALIENIDIRIPVTFSIETVSVTGQTSHRVEMQFDGNMLSPFLTESMASESAADTEVSSIFSDFEEPQKRTFMAIYDYIPADHSPNDYPAFELQFNEGDIITIYGPPRPDGFYHGKLHGKKGLVPSNFIEEIHVSGNKGRKKKKSRSQGSLHNGHSSTASDSPRQRSGRNNRPPPGKNSLGGSRV